MLNIGDKVLTLDGVKGKIEDKLYSEAMDKFWYTVDGKMYKEDELKVMPELPNDRWSYEFNVANNVVIAILYEEVDGQKTEIARGHGHVIHAGVKGFTQASSYALKKIYEKYNGGNV